MVGIAEDLFSAATVYVEHKLRAGSEPGAEGRMLQISLGLGEGGNGKLPRHFTVTKTGDLRKDEPDPMAGLSPGQEFSEDCVVDGLLGVEEAVEIVIIVHKLSAAKHVVFKTISCLTRLVCET